MSQLFENIESLKRCKRIKADFNVKGNQQFLLSQN